MSRRGVLFVLYLLIVGLVASSAIADAAGWNGWSW